MNSEWRGGRLTGATLGAWRTVHRLNGTDASWSVWGGLSGVVCLVPGIGFAHVDLGLDPRGLFLACQRGGLYCFSVKMLAMTGCLFGV